MPPPAPARAPPGRGLGSHLLRALASILPPAKAEEAAQTPAPDPEHMGDAARGAAWRWVDGWGEQDGKAIGSTHGCMAVDSEGRILVNTDTEDAVLVMALKDTPHSQLARKYLHNGRFF